MNKISTISSIKRTFSSSIKTFITLFIFLLYLPLVGQEYAPRIQIFNDQDELGQACAREIADLIIANQSQGRSTILGFATGSSPLPVYKALIDIVKQEELDLSQVVTFNLDEYCRLAPHHPESYHSFMFTYLFNDLLSSPTNPKGLRLENIHIPKGYAKKEEDLSLEELNALNQHFPERLTFSPLTQAEEFWILQQRADQYETLIREKGPIHLQLLGIGTNGHIGFAEPGSSLEGKTMLVKLSENTRKDNARFFDEIIDQVPEYALTMGIGTILQAERVILLASGQKKANIIEKTLNQPISSEIPATALRMHPSVSFFLDTQAASMMQQGITRYYHARIVRNHELTFGELWTANGKIIPPQEKANHEVDVQGLIIAPGYIDLQLNGGFGIDFSVQADKVKEVASRLPQYGVTSFLPTLVSLEKKQYPHLLPHLQPSPGGAHGATILGIHLEGPFFHPSKHGAHNPHFIRSLDEPIEAYYGSLEGVKIVTLAPEIPGALETIRELKAKKIIVAAGHSNATYEEAKLAIQEGVSMATHLFNAMPPFHHRTPGLVGAILSDHSISYSIIADGIHLHPDIIHFAWKVNPKGLFLVTDAIEALGLPPGVYHLGNMEVEVKEKGAYILGTQTIAGSVLSMDAAVRFFKASTACSLVEAIEVASWKPAQILGIQETKGHLNAGADADFIFLDDNLYVQACYISGQLAWQQPNKKE